MMSPDDWIAECLHEVNVHQVVKLRLVSISTIKKWFQPAERFEFNPEEGPLDPLNVTPYGVQHYSIFVKCPCYPTPFKPSVAHFRCKAHKELLRRIATEAANPNTTSPSKFVVNWAYFRVSAGDLPEPNEALRPPHLCNDLHSARPLVERDIDVEKKIESAPRPAPRVKQFITQRHEGDHCALPYGNMRLRSPEKKALMEDLRLRQTMSLLDGTRPFKITQWKSLRRIVGFEYDDSIRILETPIEEEVTKSARCLLRLSGYECDVVNPSDLWCLLHIVSCRSFGKKYYMALKLAPLSHHDRVGLYHNVYALDRASSFWLSFDDTLTITAISTNASVQTLHGVTYFGNLKLKRQKKAFCGEEDIPIQDTLHGTCDIADPSYPHGGTAMDIGD